MKRPFLTIVFVLLLCFVGGCEKSDTRDAAELSANIEKDIEAIKSLLAQNEKMISSEDLDGWINQFTDDAVFLPPNTSIRRGKEEGREFARPFFEQLDMEFDITVDEIEVHGDLAFARWSFIGRNTPIVGGEATHSSGKEIWILRRQPDHSWKCSHIIYNYDSP